MKYKVVGCEHREGDMQDRVTKANVHFNYYILHVVSAEKKSTEMFGVCPEQIKLRSKFVDDEQLDLKSLNQKMIEVYYDQYKNVAKIITE